jgi:hypothetical protein
MLSQVELELFGNVLVAGLLGFVVGLGANSSEPPDRLRLPGRRHDPEGGRHCAWADYGRRHQGGGGRGSGRRDGPLSARRPRHFADHGGLFGAERVVSIKKRRAATLDRAFVARTSSARGDPLHPSVGGPCAWVGRISTIPGAVTGPRTRCRAKWRWSSTARGHNVLEPGAGHGYSFVPIWHVIPLCIAGF